MFRKVDTDRLFSPLSLGNGHTTLNIPVLVRSLKSSNVGPGQYLDGRPPGNTGCCWLFVFPCEMYSFFVFRFRHRSRDLYSASDTGSGTFQFYIDVFQIFFKSMYCFYINVFFLGSQDDKTKLALISTTSDLCGIRVQKQSFMQKSFFASSGNRTRAARVAGEHSTTEPTMLGYLFSS